MRFHSRAISDMDCRSSGCELRDLFGMWRPQQMLRDESVNMEPLTKTLQSAMQPSTLHHLWQSKLSVL